MLRSVVGTFGLYGGKNEGSEMPGCSVDFLPTPAAGARAPIVQEMPSLGTFSKKAMSTLRAGPGACWRHPSN